MQKAVAQVTFVNVSAIGTNDGSSWANAYNDLQAALANTNSGQIWVAQGTYLPSQCNPCVAADRETSFFALKSDVVLYGGFNGTESNLSQRDFVGNPTILSGDIGTPGDSLDNAYRVIIAEFVNSGCILDGFIIEEGNADGSFGFSNGGGLLIDANPGGNSSPTIANCIIRNNYAGGGGGVQIDCVLGGTSTASFTNCMFIGNTASLQVFSTGAAVMCVGNSAAQIFPSFTDCDFQDNYVGNDGGAISSTPSGAGTVVGIQITNCNFTNNEATDRGGALWMRVTSGAVNQSVITNCTFTGNISGGQGGAIYDRASFGATSLTQYINCTISGNISTGTSTLNDGDGGGIYLRGSQSGGSCQTVIDGCIIDGNQAENDGGGIVLYGWQDGSCQPTIINTDITGNTAIEKGGGIQLIVEDNGTLSPTFANCTIDGNISRDGGGINFKPDFSTTGSVNLTLNGCTVSSNTAQNADFSNGFSAQGGGINLNLTVGVAVSVSLMIDNCIFDGNSAISSGGAISNQFSGQVFSPVITNSTFSNNLGSQPPITSSGGAINFFGNSGAQITPFFSNCIFEGNTCVNNDGGAVSATPSGAGTLFNPTFENCQFISNTASDRGGAMWWRLVADGTLAGTIRNCSFIGNSAGGVGGALVNRTSFGATGSTKILNCVFEGNSSGTPSFPTDEDGGGAIYIRGSQDGTNQGVIANCLFNGNTSNTKGGAILVTATLNSANPGTCIPTIVNNTFINNSASDPGNGIYVAFAQPLIANNILWDGIDELEGNDHTPIVSNNIIQSGYSGPGTISNVLTDDPIFVNADNDDYHLTPCSPAIDFGSNAILPPDASTFDLDGNARILNGNVDLGAFEYNGGIQALEISIDSTNVSCFNGCDGQATVNASFGTPGYSINWSNGSTAPTINDLCPGVFTVSVTDNGQCLRIDSVVITQPPEIFVQASNDTSICSGQQVNIEASASGGSGNFTYQWNEGLGAGATHSVAPTESTTYVVSVSDGGSCVFTDTVDVVITTGPELDISGDTSYCTGNTTLLDAGTFLTYQWSTGELTQQISISTPGVYTVSVTDNSGCIGADEVTVVENALPQPIIAGDLFFCQGQTTALDAGDFSAFLWSTGETTQLISVGTEGAYTVTVTDGNECLGSTSVNVSENVPPVPTISGNSNFCSGQTTELDAGIFSSYLWSTGATTQMINTGIAGIYSVTVTDVDGCTGTNEISVTELSPTIPDITGDLEICTGEVTSLNAGSFVTYMWSTGESTAQIPVSTGGIFIVTVTDGNGCTGENMVEVIENQVPAPSISGEIEYCQGASTQLDAGAFSSYFWSTGESIQLITAFNPGLYTVTVTDVNGCSGSTSVFVQEFNPPTPAISGVENICPGQSAQLDAGNFNTHQWSNGENTQIVEISDPGIYTVTVSDGNGCTGTDEIEINQFDAPQPEITGDQDICPGEEIFIGTQVYPSYSWSNGETTQSISVIVDGLYSVTVTDGNGCTGEQSVEIFENVPPEPEISGDLTFCSGLNTALDAGEFEFFLWSTGESNQIITIDEPGIYSVTVTDITGCTGTDQVEVETINVEPEIIGQLSICFGNTTTLEVNEFESYQWSTNEFTGEIEVASGGIYSVTVTDQNGCVGTDEVFVSQTDALMPDITGDAQICTGSEAFLDAGIFDQYEWSTGEMSQIIIVNTPGNYSLTVTDDSGCSGTTEIQLEEVAPPLPEITGNLSVCSDELASLSVGEFSSYEWSNGFTSQSIEVLESGLYVVTVTDVNGCTGSNEVVVDIFPNPEPEIEGESGFCIGDTLELSLDPFSGYEWSIGSNESSIHISEPGIYSVIVTDENGCTGTDEIIIDQFENIDATISGSTSFCFGNSTTLSVEPGDEIQWSTGEETTSIQVENPGEYSVTVTSTFGCSDSDTVVVQENASLDPQVEGAAHLCSGDTLILSAGTFEEYAWSTGSVEQIVQIIHGGIYSLTVSDGTGCTGEESILIDESSSPIPNIVGADAFCAGDSILLSTGLFETYLWSDGSTTQSAIIHDGGIYAVTVTDSFGCIGTDLVVITENEIPEPLILGSSSFCTGSSTVLDAGTFPFYTWSTGVSTQIISVSTPGTYSVTVTDDNSCSGETSINVTEEEELMPNITGDLTICFGDSTTLSSGSFENHFWSNGETSEAIVVDSAGVYAVTVTDAGGCTGETFVEVTIDDIVTPFIEGDLSLCSGGITVLQVGDFESYQWSNGTEMQQIEVSNAGTYSVTVTSASGCTGEAIVEVVESESLLPEISGVLQICTGGSTILDAGEFMMYSWSDGSETQQIEVSNAGIYSVTVTDGSDCIGVAMVEVTESENLNPEITGILQICFGGSTMLNVGDFSTYTWSNGSETQQIEVSSAGTYSVTVSDANGCTGETKVEVTESKSLLPEISGVLQICTGGSTILDAGEFMMYSWSDGSGMQQIEVSTAGAYSVTVTDGSGCTGEAMVEVIESESLLPEISGALQFCTGGSTILDVGEFLMYSWSDGSEMHQIEVSTTGAYSVTVTDENGCTGEATVDVTESENLIPFIEGASVICQGGTTTLTVDVFDSYFWSTGSDMNQIIVSTPGTYSLTVSDENGCSGESTVVIDTFSAFQIDAGQDVILGNEQPVQLQASQAESFLWSGPLETLSCVNCSSPVATPSESTTYYVTGLDENGCTAVDSVTIFVLVDLNIDPVNTITPNGDGINDVFFVRGIEPFENAKLTIFNRWGDVIYSSASYQNDWEGTYQGDPVPMGTYLYILKVQVFDQIAELKGTITIIRE